MIDCKMDRMPLDEVRALAAEPCAYHIAVLDDPGMTCESVHVLGLPDYCEPCRARRSLTRETA